MPGGTDSQITGSACEKFVKPVPAEDAASGAPVIDGVRKFGRGEAQAWQEEVLTSYKMSLLGRYFLRCAEIRTKTFRCQRVANDDRRDRIRPFRMRSCSIGGRKLAVPGLHLYGNRVNQALEIAR